MSNPQRYDLLSILLHWVTVLLIVLSYLSMKTEWLDEMISSYDLHLTVGVILLLMTSLRLILRLSLASPQPVLTTPRMQLIAAKGVHLGLYIVLLIMPMSGWLMLNAQGDVVSFFGWNMPVLIDTHDTSAERLESIHKILANLGLGLISMHAVAALLHHYAFKDHTLKRMLPWS